MAFAAETICVQGSNERRDPFGAISMPIYQNAAYAHPGLGISPFNGVVRESASAMPPSPSAIHTFTGVMDICAKYAKINSLYKTDKNGSSDAKTETLFSRSAA